MKPNDFEEKGIDMKLFAPKYYQKFRCAAGACAHTCCVGWEIDVDEKTAARYEALEGKAGHAVRAALLQDEEGTHIALTADDRCPFLDGEGLCRIISTLGEDFLCEICREHPRFYNTVGTCMECGLGASCETAARLILEEPDYRTLVAVGEVKDIAEEPAPSFDVAGAREALYSILSDGTQPLAARLAQIRERYAILSLSPTAYRVLFTSLEYLDEAHRALFADFTGALDCSPETERAAERFFAYLVYRHTGAAQDASDFRAAVGLAFLLTELFLQLIEVNGLAPVVSARIVSEEIEYSLDNTAAIASAATGEPL